MTISWNFSGASTKFIKEGEVMLMKQCPKCGQKAFSIYNTGEWKCPYDGCGEDLNDVKAIPAMGD